MIKKNNANFYFLILPDYFRYSEVKAIDEDYKKKEIIKILEEFKIEIFDFHEDVIVTKKDPLSFYPFRKNNHFNKLGYQELAKYINNMIKN